MAHLLIVTGGLMQIVGVGVAGWGLWKTWREFASEGDRFLAPAIGAAQAAARRARALALRVAARFGFGRDITIRAGTAHLNVGLGQVKVRGRVGWRELPGDLPASAAIAELDQRTRDLANRLGDVGEKLEDEGERAQQQETALGERIDATNDQVERQTRRIAVGGVRLEATGLFLIALGLLLQTIGSFVTTA